MRLFLMSLLDVALGHKVIVSRSDLVKAWRQEVSGSDVHTVSDPSGTLYNSAFNDFCKALGLKEGK